ncbi:HNH endonuclease [Microcoleus sp. FACHB-SPT15]|uniref:HNH endonuclease n=1 Tax=Microcoleus sp. FACHB-SPT15 TaxID=2692830 RepID=UPI00178217DD|nr:HNH endonuclease [Microcoleus sp. FACHB-SPT15]MBD1809903.1 HNH endonuclease [Microcoleus sp. FACHB-SPT15]
MPEQDSSKVFRVAFDQMLDYLKLQGIHAKDIKDSTGVSDSSISEFRKGEHIMGIHNLEKILLDDIVSDEALNKFIEEVKRLLKCYRNHQEEDEEEPIGDENSDLEENPLLGNIKTSEGLRQGSYRIGQENFSDNVCSNYSNCCCFPECQIDERTFLRGAHIARWVDVEELRGDPSNGLCLCLMHDKAFEAGFFTLTKDWRVAVNKNNQTAMTSKWCEKHLVPYDRNSIRLGSVKPSLEALRYHWDRIGFTPDS